MDFQRLARQLVRAIRGQRSQRGLSKRLQFTTNVVYLWESGRRFPPAHTFFWLAHRVQGVDGLGGFDAPARTEPLFRESSIVGLLKQWQSDRTATEIADAMGLSRHVVGRWLRGTTVPKLAHLLEFIDVCTTQVLDFVAVFVDPTQLEEAAPRWRRTVAARQLTHEEPWCPPVLLSLELNRYASLARHDDQWIADALGIGSDCVGRCLGLLAEAGQIEHDGTHWKRVEVHSVDTRLDSDPHELPRRWAHVAADRIDDDSIASFSLGTVSEEDYRRMQDAQRAHYYAMRAMIAASRSPDRLVLLSFQTLALDQVSTGRRFGKVHRT